MITDCTEEIRREARDPRLYLEQGQAHAGLGRIEQAIRDYDRSIRLDPNNAAACLSCSDAKSEIGQHEKAIKDFDRAVQLDRHLDPASEGS